MAPECIDWDSMGLGFLNVALKEVLEQFVGVAGTRGLCSLVRQFVCQREFKVSCDGKVRVKGRLTVGIPRGPVYCRCYSLSGWL